MPAPRKTPPLAKIKAEAHKHKTLTALANALGIKPNTLVNSLKSEGKSAEVKALLAAEVLTPRDVGEVDETEQLHQRIAELERSERAHRKVDVLESRILDTFERAIEARKPTYNPKVIPKAKVDEHEFVLLWSDTHAGEVVSEVETNGLNAYDWRIMLKRLDKVRESVFSYQDNRPYPVSKLHICALGDMLSGDIHDELVETNEFPMAEATIQFAEDGATFVESFLERFASIRFAGVVGNHPRANRKPQAKQAFNNGDWLAYRAMALATRNQKAITWEVPRSSAHPIEVCGKRLLLWHGDGVRSTMPGVPWGGVMRRVQSLSGQYAAKGMGLDHFCVGHFHQSNAVQGGRILMNGSVKGVDEYTLKAFGGGEEPRQLLLTFHKRRGLCDVSLIDCA